MGYRLRCSGGCCAWGARRARSPRRLHRAGGALIDHISWIFYVFGTLVLLAGTRMFRSAPAAIEVTDLMFALDSIPAVFGVTRNLFVVFTSNAFAVLGLRALYLLLAGSLDLFCYLRQGIALLLVFIGTKMLISPVVHLPVTVSLAVIVAVVAGAVAASRWRDRTRPGQVRARERRVRS